jgi:hypothetical protein
LIGDYFLLSYNIPTYSDEIKIKENQSCSSGCFMIAARLIQLNNKTGEMGVFQENIMCPSISSKVEKNWSFWILQNKGLFHTFVTKNDSAIFSLLLLDPEPNKMMRPLSSATLTPRSIFFLPLFSSNKRFPNLSAGKAALETRIVSKSIKTINWHHPEQ